LGKPGRPFLGGMRTMCEGRISIGNALIVDASDKIGI
jgi:hypothetical protein